MKTSITPKQAINKIYNILDTIEYMNQENSEFHFMQSSSISKAHYIVQPYWERVVLDFIYFKLSIPYRVKRNKIFISFAAIVMYPMVEYDDIFSCEFDEISHSVNNTINQIIDGEDLGYFYTELIKFINGRSNELIKTFYQNIDEKAFNLDSKRLSKLAGNIASNPTENFLQLIYRLTMISKFIQNKYL